ncbi:hypothetical protein AB1Y20_012444 [Prymnesium parvum]|uniref:Serine/threonine specific protein phosphatases domain-containing protein n=1 Tax=Prymnesium parvum TaxID=97485 RepID=A0AB34IKV5_PRYPA
MGTSWLESLRAEYFAEDLEIPAGAETSWSLDQARVFFESGGMVVPEATSPMEECTDQSMEGAHSGEASGSSAGEPLEDVPMRVVVEPPEWYEVVHHLVYERDAPSTRSRRLRFRTRGTRVRVRARCGEWVLLDEEEPTLPNAGQGSGAWGGGSAPARCEQERWMLTHGSSVGIGDVPLLIHLGREPPPNDLIGPLQGLPPEALSLLNAEGETELWRSWPMTHERTVEMARAALEGRLPSAAFASRVLVEGARLLNSLPSLVEVHIPHGGYINVCGDTHGQFEDLMHLFEQHGFPSEANPYMFNGDYVDRGSQSIEVFLVLLCFKLLYPQHVHLSRGNHESRYLNQLYGFDIEITQKFSSAMIPLIAVTFMTLPLAHVIRGSVEQGVLVLHGGLFSRDDVSLEDIKQIERRCEPPEQGIMCELLWSDPQPMPGRSLNPRGVALCFGPDVTSRFLERNGLQLLVRSHQVKAEGYEIEANGKLVTVFSAPNYCGLMGNLGAMLRFNEWLEYTPIQFNAARTFYESRMSSDVSL